MQSDVPLPEVTKREKSGILLFFAYVILITLILTIALCAMSALVIRGIDDVIPSAAPLIGLDDETAGMLSAIFSQLDHAELSVHHEIPAVLSFIFTLCIGLILRAGKGPSGLSFAAAIVIAIIIGIICTVFALCVSVWMTDVNDIRFGDVVLSLAEMIKAGFLDNL